MIDNMEILLESFERCRKGSGWKTSVQSFERRKMIECWKLAESLKDRTYQQKPFREFTICERGKARPIRAMHVADRVVQRAFCDRILVPALLPKLIHDNGASLQGKGVSFARNRIETHLRNYWLRNGSKGYVLLMDFSKFFDNIPHEMVLDRLKEIPSIKPWMWLLERMLKSFEYDVSYGWDENAPFNSARHREIVASGGLQNGSKILRKSLGIGSQISQILGVWYPAPIDTWCKCVKGLKEYGRYMDDIYAFHPSKEYLKEIRDGIIGRARKMGMFINPKKTRICRIDRKFTFLKVQYRLEENGRIWKRLSSRTFIRMRRKLKKLKRMLLEGRIVEEYVLQCYESWKGMVLKYKASRKPLEATEEVFKRLFGDLKRKSRKKRTNGARLFQQARSRHFRLESVIRPDLIGKRNQYEEQEYLKPRKPYFDTKHWE